MKIAMTRAHLGPIGVVLALLSVVSAYQPALVSAQTGSQQDWSSPAVIFDGRGRFVLAPRMVSDPSGGAHLFWQVDRSKTDESDALVYYSRLIGTRWSSPVDILLSPDRGPVRNPVATIDKTGRLHLIWSGTSLFYSSAPADAAGSARAWGRAKSLAGYGLYSDIVSDQDGVLHIVYSLASGDTYHMKSDDAGEHWSIPVNVSSVSSKTATNWTRLAIDKSGGIHVVWDQYNLPEGYPPYGVFYSRSVDGGRTWALARTLAGIDYGMPAIAIDGQGTIHVAWDGDAKVQGRFARWSFDGGSSWSKAVNLTGGKGGLTGSPDMSVDSEGTAYLVTSDRGNDGQYGVFLSSWDGKGWTSPAIVSPKSVSTNVWYGERATIGVIDGNRLEVVVPGNMEQIWHTSRVLASRRLDLLPRPTQALSRTAPPTEAATVHLESNLSATVATPTNTSAFGNSSDPYPNSPYLPVVVGALPVLFALVAVFLVKNLHTPS